MIERVDVLVVGAGLMGSATAWAASQRGLSVLVVEQFEPGHRHGSSHGSARIVRRAYSDPLYTQLSGRAFELWRELEGDAGQPVLRMLGGLDFGPRRDVRAVAEHLAAGGVAHEVLDAADAERRWPGMRFGGPVVYHPQAGTVDADAAVAAFLDGARRRGAQLLSSTAVVSVRPDGDGAAVTLADGAALRAGQVVVAAGAWVGPLLDGLAPLPPLRVTQEQIFHFPRLDAAAEPWPSVIHEDELRVYHLAGGRDGGPGDDRKIGDHEGGRPVTAAARDGAVDPAGRQRIIEYVKRWLPGLDPTPRGEATCLYTSTPSEDFILDRVGPLVVCSPCSGHGAKFAPLIGELATDLLLGRDTVPDRFRLATHATRRSGSVSL
jgi:monomeric sarcosine oxidase